MLRAGAAAAIVVASLLFSFIAGELALRAIGFSYPVFHVPDDLAGVRLRAGASGWYRDEGEAFVAINADGWRDRPRAREKPAGVRRIAVLGDSFMEAIQVDLDATFASRLEAEVNACRAAGSAEFEVLNFGVSSYGTAQQLITLRERVRAYSPDVVLLAFLPANDVRNNARSLETWKARPFYSVLDGRLALDASFRSEPAFRKSRRAAEWQAPLNDLRLYQLVRRVRDGNYRAWNDAPAAAAAAAGQGVSLGEAGLAERAYLPPADPQWRDAWAITDKLISAMAREAAEQAAEFVVAVVPSPAAVFPDAKLRKRYAAALGVADLRYPERRIQRLGAKEGFDVLAMSEALQRQADSAHAYLHGFPNTRLGFGHWNAQGHAAAASVAARHFCES